MAPETINNGYRATILAQWNYAWRKRLVDDQPRDVERFPVKKRIPDAWSCEEYGRILMAAKLTEGAILGVPAGRWWLALLLTVYDTGLRIGALMQLKPEDFDRDTGWLSVPAEVQKQNADQVFRLHADTLEAIDKTKYGAREWLFPWPYDPDSRYCVLRRHYRKILTRAGLPTGPRDLFHKIRRTSGTYFAAATSEAEAQKHFGHSSPQVTKRYLDPRKIRRVHAADVMERPKLHRETDVA